ncbi:MAG: ADP-ribosylglycohydrolase family protein [Candidatus Faecivicinus sp.]|nr:ADP-ribosylglycohydrolase family protein [Candidatus Faecivicinus sp.]
MIGAIIGDIIGSKYEFHNIRTKEFPMLSPDCDYTDDSLMTIAVGKALLKWKDEGAPLNRATVEAMQAIGSSYPYPKGAYGGRFAGWLVSKHPEPYNSLGNGSAMRVSPCGEMASNLEEARRLARETAAVTHNHPEGIRGAQAVAEAIFRARQGASIPEIRAAMEAYYPLNQTLAEIHAVYRYTETCEGTVPPAIVAFLESTSFEDAVRNAVSLGGDCDTLTAIAASIAWPYYARRGIDDCMRELRERALQMLPEELREVVVLWEKRFG